MSMEESMHSGAVARFGVRETDSILETTLIALSRAIKPRLTIWSIMLSTYV
jgi:hypothetical protein